MDAWKKELNVYLEDINKFHTDLKFTSDSSEENPAFLDLKVKLNQGKIETDLLVKPTDRHQYLDYTSSHPELTKRSVVFNQSLRVSRICFHGKDSRKYTTEMGSWFYKRGYPKRLVEKKWVKLNSLGVPEETKEKRKAFPLLSHES